MNILLTGASSFTGRWFAHALAEAGHRVVAAFTQTGPDAYHDPLRKRRVADAVDVAAPLWNCRFGDERFVAAIDEFAVDLLCHHGADATDYRSPQFDFARALARNTHRLPETLAALAARGGRMILTGSVFEGGEGVGGEGLPHFSPYGLAKSLTAHTCEHFCRVAGVPLQKFVIPNPFGPFEEARFTTWLIRTWHAGEAATVRTPDYVRDNIPVRLLAGCYAWLAGQGSAGPARLAPSGYVESQGAFAQRFAREIGPRLGLDGQLELARQTEFAEPRVRINPDAAIHCCPQWDEPAAWDELAEYYRREVLAPS